jgi:hypothetical protein
MKTTRRQFVKANLAGALAAAVPASALVAEKTAIVPDDARHPGTGRLRTKGLPAYPLLQYHRPTSHCNNAGRSMLAAKVADRLIAFDTKLAKMGIDKDSLLADHELVGLQLVHGVLLGLYATATPAVHVLTKQ